MLLKTTPGPVGRVARACPGMASLEADAPSGGGGKRVTELIYGPNSYQQPYPGHEAFAALVKAHGATLTKINLLCVWAGP